MSDDGFNPDLDRDAQRLMHDELDSVAAIFEQIPVELSACITIVICDEEGHTHSYYRARKQTLNDAVNLTQGMLTVTRQVLLSPNADDEDYEWDR